MYDRFFNPSSQRWIKTDSKLAKSILKNYTHDTVMNPKSMKLISSKSSIGRSVLNKYRAYAKGGVSIDNKTVSPELVFLIDQATDQDLKAFQQYLISYIQGMFNAATMIPKMKRGGANPLFQQVVAPIFGFMTGFLILMQNGPQNDASFLYIQDYVKDSIQSGLTEDAVHLKMHTPYDRLVIESTMTNFANTDDTRYAAVIFVTMIVMFVSFMYLMINLIQMIGNVVGAKIENKLKERNKLKMYMQHLNKYKDVLDTNVFNDFKKQINEQKFVFEIKQNSTPQNKDGTLRLIADIYANTNQPRDTVSKQLGVVHEAQNTIESAYTFTIQPDGTPKISVNDNLLKIIRGQNVVANQVSDVLTTLIDFNNAIVNS